MGESGIYSSNLLIRIKIHPDVILSEAKNLIPGCLRNGRRGSKELPTLKSEESNCYFSLIINLLNSLYNGTTIFTGCHHTRI